MLMHPLVHLIRTCSQSVGGDADCCYCIYIIGTGVVDCYEDAARFSTDAFIH